MSQPNAIDLDLVDQIISHVPSHAWQHVKSSVIEHFVDNMTSEILQQLTGDPCGFEKAEAILDNYYTLPDLNKELIIDMVKIMGIENTVNFLDCLKLDEIPTDDME